ncbi:exosortase A-associated hydrolase 2 [Niveibacterium umoris]|uniref:Exosortase A-associated hydrolase 2 n=2 Tax=Niveibacterium umoris TaxID=1193620 RepID=A0A840BJ01_9RHOO|nr:exosortase A-associated hydrolase 2 [Niveibacterium umoris]
MRFEPHGVPARGRLVLLQPFAEEANKSRRQLADIARTAAAAGWNVVLGDYLGTGDSAGDFGDATWRDWVDDVALFANLAGASSLPLVLCALRLGALLADEAVRGGLRPTALVAINPVVSGKQALTQFLRLGAASELAQDTTARIDTRFLRQRLSAGESVEIAGYALSPALANELESAEFAPNSMVSRLGWIEVGPDAEVLSPAAARQLAKIHETGGAQVATATLKGPAFWQTQEIERVPDLAQTCLAMLQELTGVPAQ